MNGWAMVSGMKIRFLSALSPLALLAASCGSPAVGDSAHRAAAEVKDAFKVEELGRFDEPWAMALLPDGSALITERKGELKLWSSPDIAKVVLRVKVDYGGQGGLGDVALAPDFKTAKTPTIYISWAEAGPNNTRGAVVGKATYLNLVDGPGVFEPQIIWRQVPKVSGRGHFSHRIAFSPDGKYLFLSSGERQKFTPAQDLSNNLGKVLRLNLDGTPAAGNPFADRGGVSAQIWSYGHRNLLGLQFDANGQLWDLEHGPAGGDELNRIEPGKNYGWPLVSDGDNYDGTPIPRNSTRPDLAQSAISWNPVIAPGDFIFYSGKMWPEWKGQALIAGMVYPGLVRVRIDGDKGREEARYPLGHRIREIREDRDGSLLLLEDGKGGRLLRLTRK
jgi:aldose sugar dehydrogenase